MAARLSTAEILAAARAADGKHSATKPVAVPAPKPAEHANAEAIAVATPPAAVPPPASISPESNVSERSMPPAMAAMLQQVRQGRGSNGPAVPAAVRSLLDAVRSNGSPAEIRPASMSAILQRVREICGTEGSTSRPAPSTTAPSTNSTPTTADAGATAAKKLSTAEILAAARKNAKPSVAASPKPATTSTAKAGPAKGGSTADILAAARRQGAVKGESTIAKAAEAKPRPASVTPKMPRPSKSVAPLEAVASVSDDGRPRPPAMSELLASVRSSALEQQAGIEYPPLAEMLSELRRLDRRAFSHATNRESANGIVARIKRWLSGSRDTYSRDTYQGASI